MTEPIIGPVPGLMTGPTVLHVAQAVDTGVAHVLDDHIRHQRANGWRVVVACSGGMLGDVARAAGAEVVAWAARREPGPGVVTEAVALAAVVRDVDPAVVHLHSAKAGLVGRLVVRGRRPTVFTPHAWSWLAAHGLTRRGARAWERFAARWADVVICLSLGERREADELGIGSRLELVRNDVPVDALRATAPPTTEAARVAVGLPADATVAVCCARLAPQKGQDVLLAAWAEVRRQVPTASLVLVGDGPDRVALEERARALDGVRFTGMVGRAESLTWMKAATVVVCPSRYEGMSLVPLEAAALGRPVVASWVEGMDGSLSAAARTIVAPEDPPALAAALVGYLGDPGLVAAGGAEAARWADDSMAVQESVLRTTEIYAELLRVGHGTRTVDR
ncbi:MAG: glycosyltransferase [Nocardioidaceae bacterium]